MKRLILANVVLGILIGCASTKKKDEDRESVAAVLGSEISLAADRSNLEELRKDIPEGTRQQNDELAQITVLMADAKTDPSKLRQQYQTVIQKKRKTFQDKVKKLRDDFTAKERSRRQDYLDKATNKRQAIDPKALERSALQRKYNELDKERRDFFSEERERRSSFEAEIRSHSRDFESYMRERSQEFNEQMREYTKRYSEQKKEKQSVKPQGASVTAPKSEFDDMDAVPSTPLGP